MSVRREAFGNPMQPAGGRLVVTGCFQADHTPLISGSKNLPVQKGESDDDG